MKKLLLALLILAGTLHTAQAQLENHYFVLPPPGGPVLVGGAAPIAPPLVYDQGVTYNTPVQYYAPVQYNAPVYYNTLPAPLPPPVCVAPACGGYYTSSVQVIPFGRRQAWSQGYAFSAQR